MYRIAMAVALCGLLAGPALAKGHKGCVHKGAVATSTSEKSAKWFAMETMVQSVGWHLWTPFVLTGKVPGYKIAKQRYRCKTSGLAVTCRGSATFCKAK